jgi:HK97 family phage major capsid protein
MATNYAEKVKENESKLESLTKSVDALVTQLSKTPAGGSVDPRSLFNGAPNVRTGENVMGSRGFSFTKMLGLITGILPMNQAKIECDIHQRMRNAYESDPSGGYNFAGRPGEKSFLAPLATGFMQDSVVPASFRHEMKSLVRAGVDGYDPEESNWYRNRYGAKALSWLNETTGGALVAPPEQGELIELLRNKEALVNAGARVVPLPPQGRLKFPRQTAASLTYWVGENSPITESDIKTGDITLQAKKLAVLIKSPNELIRFASPAVEALIRDDMTKSLALGLDLAGLEATGTDNRPRGLLNMENITRITSSDARPNGDRLCGEDIYRMIAAVEEANAEFEGYIMRPKTLYKYYQLRGDAVAQGDKAGPFLFNLIREQTESAPATLAGYPITKSTQVSQVRSKGTASNLTYVVGGMWSDLLIGMFGAIEFSATTMGDGAFTNDQTWVKGILSADIQARHEAAFVLLDNIDTTI